MRKVREVLRLKHALGMSYRKISEATGAGKTQAAEYVRRAQAAGIGWPIPEGIDDTELERRLFPVSADSANKRPAGDWPAIPDPAPGELALVCAGPTSTSTRAWRACTGPGTATCAPTASPPCSAAPWLTVASAMTRCGSDPARCWRQMNWPPATAMPPG